LNQLFPTEEEEEKEEEREEDVLWFGSQRVGRSEFSPLYSPPPPPPYFPPFN